VVSPSSPRSRHGANDQRGHALNEPLSIKGVGEGACSAATAAPTLQAGLPNRAALAANWVANLAMSSRRRNFCFLNLLNLALSPFCDDICPRSCNLFVTQRAEDKSVRSSMRQATDGRCEAQGTLRRNPLQLAGPIARLAPWLPTKCPAACPQHTLFFERPAMSLRTRKLGPTQRPSRGSRETGIAVRTPR
jgi:hypothetical protein